MSNSVKISDIISNQIKNIKDPKAFNDFGLVTTVGDGIAELYGIKDAFFGEIIEFDGGSVGIVFNLNEHSVGVAIMQDKGIKSGGSAYRTKKIISAKSGKSSLGRVVNALGNPIDNKGPIEEDYDQYVDSVAPGIMARKSVHESFYTGVKAIDALIPIGRGQRELIIGDRQTGKTAIIVDSIINQARINSTVEDKEKVYCIYVAIGQKRSSIANLHKTLEDNGAMKNTCIVAATASDSAVEQYMAPYIGCAIGEYFRDRGMHAVVYYDDLTKQAIAYRSMSLLLRYPPGREAYPGDVFYLHSRLLERAAKLNDENGGGSLTAIPVIETQANDIAAYIPTNVISITDGQIFLETDLFYQGIKPAVNIGASVSRVGRAAQSKAMKKVSGSLKLDLSQYRELEKFSKFESELDEITLAQLDKGQKLTELLKQAQFKPFLMEEQVVSIFAGANGYLRDIPLDKVQSFEAELLNSVKYNSPEILKSIRDTKDLSDEIVAKLKDIIVSVKQSFINAA